MTDGERSFVVDRVEGDVAVLVEDAAGETLDVPLAALPPLARAGTHLRLTRAAGEAVWRVDEAAREEARASVRSLQERLRARTRSQGGNP